MTSLLRLAKGNTRGSLVGRSISFNGCKTLEDACNYSIKQEEGEEDFRELVKIFDVDAYMRMMRVL